MQRFRDVVIAGVGLTRFDRYDGEKGRPYKEYTDLGSEAIQKALESAGMAWKDIQAAFCGSTYCDTASGHQTIGKIGMTGIPIVNVENACSSGASAFRLAYQAVCADIYDVVLAAGFEKMPRGFIRSTSWPEWQRYMGFNIQPASYAMQTVRYMSETGATVEDFSRVTVKNRKNGALNPNARFQTEVTLEEVLGSPPHCQAAQPPARLPPGGRRGRGHPLPPGPAAGREHPGLRGRLGAHQRDLRLRVRRREQPREHARADQALRGAGL